MDKLLDSVLGFIRKQDLLKAGERLGIAVSGGADSVALLRIFLELRAELGVVLSLLHLNHCLRGEEADLDQQFVERLAQSYGLELVSERLEVGAYAANHRLGIETAAREVRYEFFSQPLQQGKLDKLATAHTLDDQAETVLLKLIRGAGTRGLAGIFPRRNLDSAAIRTRDAAAIIRPLLGTPRAHLIRYLGEIGQPWREDATNRDLRISRNLVRHRIVPILAEHLNPRVQETLAETSEIARAEEEFWRQELGPWLRCAWQEEEVGGKLKGDKLEELCLAARRRLLRAAAESLGITVEFRHVEAVLGLDREGQQVALPMGWVVVRHRGNLCFRRHSAAAVDYEYELLLPGRIAVPEAALFLETRYVGHDTPGEHHGPEQLIDVTLAQRGLRARNWRPGERFWPAHTKQPKKVKELLSERHIQGLEKKHWTVVASGEEIVWMRGFGVRKDRQAPGKEGVLIRELPIEATG